MSSSNGMFYTEKSMNGIITLSDGQGVEISDGDLQSATIHTDNIQAINPADDVYLYTNSTGTIYTGFGALSADNLQGSTPATNITMYTNTTTGTIDLGTLTTGQITIGNTNTNKIGGISINNTTLTTSSVSSIVNMWNNLTNGSLNIATSLASGTITIGTTNATDCFISNINVRGSEIYGRVVSGTFGLYDNITTGVVNICSGLLSSGALNIALGTAGSIIIGGSGNINLGQNITTNAVSIGSTSSTTGGLKLYSPITLAYTALTTPNVGQVGGVAGGSFGSVSVGATAVTIANFSIGIGVWILFGNARAVNQPSFYFNLSIKLNSVALDPLCQTGGYTQAGIVPNLQVSKIVVITSGTLNWCLNATCGTSAVTVDSILFQAIRIA